MREIAFESDGSRLEHRNHRPELRRGEWPLAIEELGVLDSDEHV
jgi:hypothetical protein